MRTPHAQSTKLELLPPTFLQVMKLAEQSRKVAVPGNSGPEAVVHPYLSRRLSPSDIEAIVARRSTGEKKKVICEDYGISESALSDLVVQAEAPVRTTTITPKHIDKAVELYESGLTVKQVVSQVGYSIRTIRRVLHQQGVTMRKGGKRIHRRQEGI